MEGDGSDILSVAIKSLNAGLGLVVPDFDQTIISTRDQVGFVATLSMSVHSKREDTPGSSRCS